MMKELYIIRHGETELNRLGIVQGRGINSDLNETGKKQAASFYAYYGHLIFDKIYTSTLKRTHQTVEGFISRGIPWQQLAGLDELAWGSWEGQPNTETARHAFKQIAEKWQGGDYDAKFEGGESPNEVMQRLTEAVTIIKNNTSEKRVLICMHGRAMRLLMCLLLDKPISEMGDFPHQNTALYKINYLEGKFGLIDFNNVAHLTGADSAIK